MQDPQRVQKGKKSQRCDEEGRSNRQVIIFEFPSLPSFYLLHLHATNIEYSFLPSFLSHPHATRHSDWKMTSSSNAQEAYMGQLVLYIRILHLLSSAIQLAQSEISSEHLRNSASVRSGRCSHHAATFQ